MTVATATQYVNMHWAQGQGSAVYAKEFFADKRTRVLNPVLQEPSSSTCILYAGLLQEPFVCVFAQAHRIHLKTYQDQT